MKKKSKFLGYAVTGALTLGLLGGFDIPAFAEADTTTAQQAINAKASLDEATKQKAQVIMKQLETNLADLGVKLPLKREFGKQREGFAQLDEATKEKVKAIMEQEKAGTITAEEVQAKLAELGVEMPQKGEFGKHANPFTNLDEATKEKVKAIMEQEKAGALTADEAQAKLAELGVEFPSKGEFSKHAEPFANLDEATKEKVQTLIDEAQAELAELGVDKSFFKF
ncbi:hypothetical protein [Lysinibacillus piscis]|uniref:Uncharacterized protein n=1 Tax=Lysinibacillus piscis TaxID=2518931 RepID=A0ABQ5NF73_9BACI|nr:hypothetical protein [Lysinibacillus sp. KH24]GLC86888.1 hypothetical protein LYSBPC_00150 [Lysinibacillus sp. KH24]